MMVGDELKAWVPSSSLCHGHTGQMDGVADAGLSVCSDYIGAKEAGLEARLIRRIGEWSDGAARQRDEDLTGVETIASLTEVVDEVRRRRSR